MPLLCDSIPTLIHNDGSYEVTDDIPHLHTKSGRRGLLKRGFRTDLASVPRFLSWLTPIAGVHNKAAIWHDRNCVEQAEAYRDGREPDVTSVETDGMFLDDLLELGVPLYRARAYWVGVRFGAAKNKARREGWWSTFLPLVLWMVLLLPVLPAALLTGATLAAGRVIGEAAEIARFLCVGKLPPAATVDAQLTRQAFDARRKP